jgi:diaminopimelate decarboxylase
VKNELEKTSGCDDDDDRSATPLYIYSQAQLHRNIQVHIPLFNLNTFK